MSVYIYLTHVIYIPFCTHYQHNPSQVLQKFKGCPYIQPHEIHGLNYDRLFPVIQFLVKQVLQTRRLTGDLVRQIAIGQYGKTDATLLQDASSANSSSSSSTLTLGSIQSQFSTNRKFRKAAQSSFVGIEDQTDATLLEYGDVTAVFKDEDEEKEKKQTQEQIEEQQKLMLEQKEHLQALQAAMSDVGGNMNKLSGSSVGNLMMRGADEIAAQNAEYEDAMAQQGDEGSIAASAMDSKTQQHLRQKRGLIKKKVCVCVCVCVCKAEEGADQEEGVCVCLYMRECIYMRFAYIVTTYSPPIYLHILYRMPSSLTLAATRRRITRPSSSPAKPLRLPWPRRTRKRRESRKRSKN
jgi:hypothetical protein